MSTWKIDETVVEMEINEYVTTLEPLPTDLLSEYSAAIALG